ncbi:MAG: adenylate/guanylate cyclase domain-containing protein [Deltaproteobacteria bacterium]|nr:adenylate/guanylate cyclase domain-containing protein [Deltaproteobacteria bacterium]
MVKILRRKDTSLFLALLVAVGAVVAGITWAGWLERPENLYYDLWHQLAGVRYQPQHVVIVALDEPTLKVHPTEPLVCWTPNFARVIQVLRRVGARVIGLDYLFQISIESWLQTLDLPLNHRSLNYDGPFKEQLASGQVVMAGYLDHQQKTIIPPIPSYLSALPRPQQEVGLINLFNDDDGAIRRFVPALADDHGRINLTFGKLLALRAAGQDPVAELARLRQEPAVRSWSAEDAAAVDLTTLPLVGFAGPPGTFPRISMQRFLAPGAAEDPTIRALKDKIVIIATEPNLQDMQATPYSLSLWHWPGNDMSGPEIHANIIETLLTGRCPRPVPGYLRSLYLFGVLLAGSFLVYRLTPGQGLAAVVALVALAGSLSYLLFRGDWLLPLANLQLAVGLSYIGILGIKFTGEERERARIRKIFSRYVADEVVEKLLASGKFPDLGGEAYRVTVLFSDIRNFTTISEKLEPRQVVEMLNTYLSRACEPILAQGGTVDKFIGDAVMAVFGAPVAYPDHARRALAAALGVAQQAREFRTWMTERFGDLELPEFAIGIGLHTGEAIVGNIGSTKRLEFTAIGDTVNAASRLESLTKELGWSIVASHSTIEAAPGVVTGRQETRTVKGRKEPLQVFEVLGLK